MFRCRYVEPFKLAKTKAAWYARDLKDKENEWIYEFSESDVAELEAAIDLIQASGKELKVRLEARSPERQRVHARTWEPLGTHTAVPKRPSLQSSDRAREGRKGPSNVARARPRASRTAVLANMPFGPGTKWSHRRPGDPR